MPAWKMTADYLQNCNCDWGCPCNFNAPATMGYCEDISAIHIQSGELDGLSLDGMDVVLVMKWPGLIHEGNGTLAAYFDPASSTEEQRNAFLTIGSGQLGGNPFAILGGTFTDFRQPKLAPIKIHVAGQDSWYNVGDVIEVEVEPMRNPVTGAFVHGSVVIPDGFIFEEAPVFSNKKCTVNDGDLNFSYPNKNAHVCVVNWSNA